MLLIAWRKLWLVVLLLLPVTWPAVPQADPADYGVSLDVHADFYALGDSVFMTLTNDTEDTMIMLNSPPYEIVNDETGEVFYVGPLPVEVYLGPHESAEYVWDQRDLLGNPAPPGRYRAEIGYVVEPGGTWQVVSDAFTILGAASIPEDPAPAVLRTWGGIKARSAAR